MAEQMATIQPVASNTAGSWLQQGNELLSSALNTWVTVEQVKAARSSSGGDQVSRLTQTDLPNGAAVQIDKPATVSEAKDDGTFKVNKAFLGYCVAALAFGLWAKSKGFK